MPRTDQQEPAQSGAQILTEALTKLADAQSDWAVTRRDQFRMALADHQSGFCDRPNDCWAVEQARQVLAAQSVS